MMKRGCSSEVARCSLLICCCLLAAVSVTTFADEDTDDIAQLHAILNGFPPGSRADAVPAIMRLGPAAAPLIDDLVARLRDQEFVYDWPIWTNWRVPKGHADLINIVFEQEGSVTLRYARTLVAIGPAAVPALVHLLGEEGLSEPSRRCAAFALGEIGVASPEVISVLKLRAETGADVATVWAAVQLWKLDRAGSGALALRTILRHAESNPVPMFRAAAILAIAETHQDSQEYLPVLQRALSDSDPLVRVAAAKALVQLHPMESASRVLPVLAEGGRDPDVWRASRCVEILASLATLSDDALQELLVLAMLDDSTREWEAEVAIQGLERIGEKALALVESKLKNPVYFNSSLRLAGLAARIRTRMDQFGAHDSSGEKSKESGS